MVISAGASAAMKRFIQLSSSKYLGTRTDSEASEGEEMDKLGREDLLGALPTV